MQAGWRLQSLPPSVESKIGARIAIVINERDSERPLFDASFVAGRVPLTEARLLSLLVGHPLMAAKVIGGNHWKVLKLGLTASFSLTAQDHRLAW
jgi:DUF1365 family protein